MSSDFIPSKKITIDEFLSKDDELKKHGIVVHPKDEDGNYLIQQDIPTNVSNIDVLRQGMGDSSLEESLFDQSMELYKQMVYDKGFSGFLDYFHNVDGCDRNPEVVMTGMFIQQKERSQYVWMYSDQEGKFVSLITRYHPNLSCYLVKTLEDVMGFKLIDESSSYEYEEVA